MYEYEFSEHLMGTTLSVALIMDDDAHASKIFSECLFRLREHEMRFSRFLPESELSQLNTERSLIVSPLFLSLTLLARDLYIKTDGHFNPLLQIERFGYTHSYNMEESHPLTRNPLPYNTNFHTVEIDTASRCITLADGQHLDFGGFLKGYLAENEAKRITHEYPEVHGIIVNIGGDLHTRGRDAHEHVFVFDIKNPITKQPISFPLEHMSLATSGTYKRTFTDGTDSMHHILARNGTENQKSGIISASVIHSSGATAEAYAKALLTIDPDTLIELTGDICTYILIHQDGTIHTSL